MSSKKRPLSKETTESGPLAKKIKTPKTSMEKSNSKKQISKQTHGKKLEDVTADKTLEVIEGKLKKDSNEKEEIKRDKHGKLVFPGHPEFKPNLTPKEVLQAGSFGGTYFRPIKSGVTGEKYSGEWKEFPSDWFNGLSISRQVSSSTYHMDVNTYNVKCGGSLEMWESSGWIVKQDPYGWFQWYCRFYLGRRTEDDQRQISRWLKCAGDKGRWRNNLISKIVRSGCCYDNFGVSPVVRQTLQHWGYRLNKEGYDKGAKRVKGR